MMLVSVWLVMDGVVCCNCGLGGCVEGFMSVCQYACVIAWKYEEVFSREWKEKRKLER